MIDILNYNALWLENAIPFLKLRHPFFYLVFLLSYIHNFSLFFSTGKKKSRIIKQRLPHTTVGWISIFHDNFQTITTVFKNNAFHKRVKRFKLSKNGLNLQKCKTEIAQNAREKAAITFKNWHNSNYTFFMQKLMEQMEIFWQSKKYHLLPFLMYSNGNYIPHFISNKTLFIG